MPSTPAPTPETEKATSPVLVLGIDPGTTCGVSMWDATNGCLRFVDSVRFLGVLGMLRIHAPSVALVVVEDTREEPIYARHRGVGGGERDRLARRVGHTDFAAAQILLACEAAGMPAQSVKAVRGEKWTAADLKRLTGWSRQTNEHGRDAARHVVGLTVADVTARLARLKP